MRDAEEQASSFLRCFTFFDFSRQSLDILCAHLSTTLAIHTCRHDAASIAGALATGEQSLHGDMLQRCRVTRNAHRR